MRDVDSFQGASADNIHKVLQTGNITLPKFLFQKAKTPVWTEFCVTCDQEVESDGHVEPSQTSPHQVRQHEFVFILTTTIVTMEIQILGAQGVVLEIMVEI